jgi:hypothetical protein
VPPLICCACVCGWTLLAGRHAIEPLTIALVGHKDGHCIGGRVFRPTPLRGAPIYMVDWQAVVIYLALGSAHSAERSRIP